MATNPVAAIHEDAMRAVMTAERVNDTGAIRATWRNVGVALRHIRDWPDPDNPYSPLLTVLLPSLFVLVAFAFR
jgi:hypothetical protein